MIDLIIAGLAVGSIYALVAFGFVLLLKSTNLLSFVQLELITLGGYIAFNFYVYNNFPFYLAVAISCISTFIFGALLYYIVVRKMSGQPRFTIVVAIIAVGIMLKAVMGSIWGYHERAFPLPFQEAPVTLWSNVSVSNIHIIIFMIALLFVLAFIGFFKYTMLGTQMRAVANDQEVAHMIGINVNKVFILSWGIAAVSAALAGIFLSSLETLNLNLGVVGIKSFPAVILGGTDSVHGAIIAGLAIGLIEVLTGYYLGQHVRTAVVFIILIIVLMIRPYGLFGEAKVERV